jgi:hypothetical protein
MDGYRLYFLDLRSGHINNFREFEAEHDAAALDAAERLRGQGPMELWCRTRKVEEWPALFAPRPRASA